LNPGLIMCGIFLSLSSTGQNCPIDDGTRALLQKRGPDTECELSLIIGNYSLYLCSTVLHMRGDTIVKQPRKSDRFILQWNGEIFDGLDVSHHENDTLSFFKALHASKDVRAVLSQIKGPWAFCLIDVHFSFSCLFL